MLVVLLVNVHRFVVCCNGNLSSCKHAEVTIEVESLFQSPLRKLIAIFVTIFSIINTSVYSLKFVPTTTTICLSPIAIVYILMFDVKVPRKTIEISVKILRESPVIAE